MVRQYQSHINLSVLLDNTPFLQLLKVKCLKGYGDDCLVQPRHCQKEEEISLQTGKVMLHESIKRKAISQDKLVKTWNYCRQTHQRETIDEYFLQNAPVVLFTKEYLFLTYIWLTVQLYCRLTH